MKRHAFLAAVLVGLSPWLNLHAAGEAFGNSFAITAMAGEVTARPPGVELFADVAEGESFPYGTEVRTGGEASAVLELGEGNVLRVRERSRITVHQDTDLIRIRLDQGEVGVQLDNRPEDVNVEVDTVLGAAIAAGTRFDVAFLRHRGDQQSYWKIEVGQGAVRVESIYVETDEDVLREGAIFEVSAILCPPRRYAFFPLVAVQGQNLQVALGNNNKLILEDGASIQVAMSNVPGDNEFAAVRVLSGRVLVGGEVIDESTPARFIQGRVIMDEHNAEDFMNSVEWLCRECERLYDPDAPLTEELLELLEELPAPDDPDFISFLDPLLPIPPLKDVPHSGAE